MYINWEYIKTILYADNVESVTAEQIVSSRGATILYLELSAVSKPRAI